MALASVGNLASDAKIFCTLLCIAIYLFLVCHFNDDTVFHQDFSIDHDVSDVLQGRGVNQCGNRIVHWNCLWTFQWIKDNQVCLFANFQRTDLFLHTDCTSTINGSQFQYLFSRNCQWVACIHLVLKSCKLHQFDHILCVVAGCTINTKAEG